jgi:hypothetical protein
MNSPQVPQQKRQRVTQFNTDTSYRCFERPGNNTTSNQHPREITAEDTNTKEQRANGLGKGQTEADDR